MSLGGKGLISSLYGRERLAANLISGCFTPSTQRLGGGGRLALDFGEEIDLLYLPEVEPRVLGNLQTVWHLCTIQLSTVSRDD
jgi:hypothetical protein